MAADHVLLLPGMLCDRRLWQYQADALGPKVHYADTTQDDSFEAMARRALDEAPPQFAMAGLSMGGILAFEIWRQAPERVTHMALLDTNPHPDTPERRSLRLEQIATALAGGLRELAVDSLKPLYLAAAHRDDEALLELVLDMAMKSGPEVFERQSQALRNRPDSTPTLETVDCPTLVLCGDEDTLCPPKYHTLMAERIRGARLCIVENCGHLSSLEQPEVVTRELQRLFAS